jgi:DNA polymerase-1
MQFAVFREIVVVDAEYSCPPGGRPTPICIVAHELRSGHKFRLWEDELQSMSVPPYASGTDALLISYNAQAEVGVYRALGWPMPPRILDLFAEFRCRTNGLPKPSGSGLLGALAYFGLDAGGVVDKDEMRAALGAGTWRERYTPEEVLRYCENDVNALTRLFAIMAFKLDLPRALLRGRYGCALAAMNDCGIPIDVETLTSLRQHWTDIKGLLIADIDRGFGVYDGLTFKRDRFAALLTSRGVAWPTLESGQLDLKDETIKDLVSLHPWLQPLRELRNTLSKLHLESLEIGTDARNRASLFPFWTSTGRNSPSPSNYIFGAAAWVRSLIKPPPGYGVAYVDWRAQEAGICAGLSGDQAMQAAYRSGDIYLGFGKRAKLIPPDATKATHAAARDLYKVVFLATMYGQGEQGLSQRIGKPLCVARDLLNAHRQAFPDFWKWSDGAVDSALLRGYLNTVFGWTVFVAGSTNPRSLRNFVAQAASDMMRLGACIATEAGVQVGGPVHDAFLIVAPLDRLDADIATMRAAMAEASCVVLGGFELATDVEVIRWPDRFVDKRGRHVWQKVMTLLQQVSTERICA